MTVIGDPPEEGSVFMDDQHAYRFVQFEGERVGITEFHYAGDHWCAGFVAFKNYDPAHGWDVEVMDPLTLSPSLLCRLCGSHGFIKQGKWISA